MALTVSLILGLLYISCSTGYCTLDNKGTIVELFEWRFQDIATECEQFLGSYGYTGVQVSPITENVKIKNRPWWERYQPISYNIVSRSGNESVFRDMVKRCAKAGIKVYVDVILNHMTANHNNAVGIAGTTADTSKFSYPAVPYYSHHFNQPTCQLKSYQNAREVRVCELNGLHDLNTTNYWVRSKQIEFLNRLLDIGVSGFRIGAAKHIWPADLQYIYSKLRKVRKLGDCWNPEPFIYQQVVDLGGETVHASEYVPLGLVTDFKYAAELGRAFRGKNPLKWLKTFGTSWGLLDSKSSFVFIDNHDTQRGQGGETPNTLTHKDDRSYKMATAFMLAWPHGTPKVMSSYYFGNKDHGPRQDETENISPVFFFGDNLCGNGWVCEHRWRQIYNMVQFRKVVSGTEVTNWWDNGNNQISFCRGNKGFIAFNIDTYDLNQNLTTCLAPGNYCDIISGKLEAGKCTGKLVIVDREGKASISVKTSELDGVLAIHQQSRIPREVSPNTESAPATTKAKVKGNFLDWLISMISNIL